MKREILCESCGKKTRARNPNDTPYPGEHIKLIEGHALKQYNCDQCNLDINKGDPCWGYTMWSENHKAYYPWEHQFLKLPVKVEYTERLIEMYQWNKRLNKDMSADDFYFSGIVFDVFVNEGEPTYWKLVGMGFDEFDAARLGAARWMMFCDVAHITVTFAEGDLCLAIHDDWESYQADIKRARCYYGRY